MILDHLQNPSMWWDVAVFGLCFASLRILRACLPRGAAGFR